MESDQSAENTFNALCELMLDIVWHYCDYTITTFIF